MFPETDIEADLARALRRGELTLDYQPQVDARTGRVAAVEALLRWRHPRRGPISPAVFIPAAERSGLIVPIGDWVLREACRQSRRWLDAGLAPARMAVNLSARQFSDERLARRIAEALDEAGLEPPDLELEITESMMARDPDAAERIVRALRSSGVRLMIDDFGTGYSSLASLKRFPVDGLKLDRAFVAHLPHDLYDATITRAVVSIARDLDLDLVAEGVETDDQRLFLAGLGCGLLQGYLTGRPQSAERVAELLSPARDHFLAGP
ncbi:MAG TPA: EAL domain-containing protein [Elusimicrobiota bacterium]|jgi:EAL domain-containing protein (putative c-di-GMP-specific phosphodiesterase class I)|nr:EAL domain-containing protein [Elusimicrobiota bacterium]